MASFPGASAVSEVEGSAEGGWDGAGPPANVDRLSVAARDDAHDARITGPPAERFGVDGIAVEFGKLPCVPGKDLVRDSDGDMGFCPPSRSGGGGRAQ